MTVKRFLRRYWLAFAIVASATILWGSLFAVREARAALTSAFLAQELFMDLPVTPLKVLGESPIYEEVRLEAPEGRGHVWADIYRPANGKRNGAILVAVGAADQIRDHEGVIRFGNAAARAGVVVMIPELYYPYPEGELPDEVQGLVNAFGTNIKELVASYLWLAEQPYVDPERIGIFGASAGGGVGLVAAADERIRDEVNFVAALGSYFDLVDLLNAIVTESITYEGETMDWEPRVRAVRLLHDSLISYVEDDHDRDILTRLFVREDSGAQRYVPELSPRGRELYDVLSSGDPDRILEFWTEVSPGDVDTLREISPSTHIRSVHADLFVMTDRGDPYIPFVESRRLLDAAEGNGNKIHYAEFDFLQHVEPGTPSSPFDLATDLTKLMYHVWLVMLRMG